MNGTRAEYVYGRGGTGRCWAREPTAIVQSIAQVVAAQPEVLADPGRAAAISKLALLIYMYLIIDQFLPSLGTTVIYLCLW